MEKNHGISTSSERPYKWTLEGSRRLWDCYARRTIESAEPSGFYPQDFYVQVLKAASRWLRGKSKALDLGCSTGTLAGLLLRRGWEVYGTDLQKEVILLLRRRFEGKSSKPYLTVNHPKSLPFEAMSFDVVFCTEVLEHMLDEDRLEMLKEVRRILRPGGVLVATTPYKERLNTVICPNCYTSFHPMGHVHSVDEKIAKAWLEDSSLQAIGEKTFPLIIKREEDGVSYRLLKEVTRLLFRRVLVGRFSSILCFVGKRVS